MATNEILQFAETDTGTNLLTQAEYLADAQRPIGNQPGVARSKLVNKALRQSSLIAAAVAQFIADNQANNVVDTANPADIADWIEAAVRSIGIPTAVAGGTADAITADFTPNVALTNGTTVIVRAGAANTTTTTTFAPDGLPAKTIVKGNNLALVAGDIAGAGHWLVMNFDTVLGKWVLQNPATGIATTATKLQTARTINGTSFDGSANITTANWGTVRTLTIGNTGKSVNGSADVSWSLDEIGAVRYATVADGIDLDTLVTPGLYRIGGTHANMPFGVQHGQLIVARGGGNTVLQIVAGYTSNKIYWRSGIPPEVNEPGQWYPWREFYHSGNISDAFKGANQSTWETGFQKLPGGLILQWGKIAEASRAIGDFELPITFPLAFPNAILNAGATVRPGDAVAVGAIDGWAAVRNTSNSSMNVVACATTSGTIVYGIYWFAIGY